MPTLNTINTFLQLAPSPPDGAPNRNLLEELSLTLQDIWRWLQSHIEVNELNFRDPIFTEDPEETQEKS